ncbi:unnamed protein product [Blepharisma stoltei]|uniref:COPI associated protein n=1 Tax=Blepharisma stoltei TaxID=1481888 RepID=A0AAU9IYX7_9CILI|nr:unnamed protein product [Blepharisma stoltei]
MVGQTFDDKRLSYAMMIASIACSSAMILIGVLFFVFWLIDDFVEFMLSIYVILFGILGILSEFTIEFISTYFSFMKKYISKGFYYIFMGTIIITWGEWWVLLASVLNIFLGILYIIFFFMLKSKLKDQEDPQKPASPEEVSQAY